MKVISTNPRSWIGFTNDPAEVTRWTVWAHIGPITVYTWGIRYYGRKWWKS